MKILSVDTTTPAGSAAVLIDGEVLAEFGLVSPTTHSSWLLGAIHHLLSSLRIDIRDIDGFAVATGPGSFTGLRIGLSTVKSLAFASGKPVAPVSSLLALAWKARDSGRVLVAPMIDAKKGEIYAAVFEFDGNRAAEIVAQGAYAPRDFVGRLPGRRRRRFCARGFH
jgi:tRNA threonylcarbamoyladenosine biosynthesis protein TsaB